jgi:hypothetical protein
MKLSGIKGHNLVVNICQIKGRQWKENRSLTTKEIATIAKLEKQVQQPPWNKQQFKTFQRICSEEG